MENTMKSVRLAWLPCLLLGMCLIPAVQGAEKSTTSPRLKISPNRRFLIQPDGSPFFYLGDTAWELFHRLNREEADRYLENRARKGFTVIQAVALAELDGLNAPNAYGHRPLIDNDPTKPDVKDGPQNDYWDHVDYIVEQANARGLFIGFLPTWGDKWNKKWGVGGGSFTPENAARYGEWLGRRYQDRAIIWILGGDRPVETDQHRAIIRAMALGLAKGDGGAHLKTFHPPGGNGSSTWWHDDDWLDFNMRQNGHVAEYTGRYDQTRADYNRSPVKPVLDGEPIYEDHPVSFDAKKLGHSIAADVRRPLYWDLFSGACGHTYGHHSVWQMYDPQRGQPINNPLLPWFEAIDQPAPARCSTPSTCCCPARSCRASRMTRSSSRIPCPRACRARDDISSVQRATSRAAGRWSTRPSAEPSTFAWTSSKARASRPGGSIRVRARRRPSMNSPIRAKAPSRRQIRAKSSTGSWCWTTRRRTIRPRERMPLQIRERYPADGHRPRRTTARPTRPWATSSWNAGSNPLPIGNGRPRGKPPSRRHALWPAS